jgi:hypothetical protein
MVHANIKIQEYGDPPPFPKLKPSDITKGNYIHSYPAAGGRK